MKRLEETIEQNIISLYQQGYSCERIGKDLGLNRSSVFNVLKRYNIPTRTKGGIYSIPIDDIINSYNNGERIPDIAKRYNVNPRTIYNYMEKNNIDRNYIYINKSLRRDYFKTIDSYDKAYFLGFMISDGCVTEDNNITMTLREEDSYILEVFRSKICNENPLYRNHNRNEATFHCKSAELRADLAKYGVVPRKSLYTYIPNNIDKIFMSHLLRGIFDGNGWISLSSHTLGYCAGNINIVISFRDIMVSELDVYSVKIVKMSENCYSCNWSSTRDIMRIFGYLYQFAGDCYLIRKYNNFMQIPSKLII